MNRKFTNLELERRAKLKAIIDNGINPYTKNLKFQDDSQSLEIKYNNFSKEELHEKLFTTTVVGRIIGVRGPFLIIKDSKGTFQVYVPHKQISGDVSLLLKYIDVGDFMWFSGIIMKTRTGELSLKLQTAQMTSKSLKPLPEKWHGLKDVEERYRRRYIDLIVNEKVQKTFWTRTKIISSIRQYFDDLAYMEVETPILQSILGGALAKPFVTYHEHLHANFYLRIATELPLKKMLVGGIERVYEIGRIFRNEGIDTTHNPEFTSIEFYEAYSNLEGMMKRTEKVFLHVAKKLKLEELNYQGQKISLTEPFQKVNMVDAVSNITGHDFRQITLELAQKIAISHNIKLEKFYTIGHIINELFESLCEKDLIQPTFVVGHPIEISPLAAKDPKDHRFTERAELFINGREYANMFTELNDPIDQLERFENQLSQRELGNQEANELDMDFIEALEYGMPPAGGCGIGIDRMVMLFTNNESIREVLLFPHLKNKKK